VKEWVGALVEWRKIGSSLAGVVCVLTALLLFTPDVFVARTGLLDLRNDYRPWLGLAFLVSLSLFAAGLLEATIGAVRGFFQERRIQRNLLAVLRDLTPDEKEFLFDYIAEGRTTISAAINDGVANALQAKKIIYRASTVGHPGGLNFPFNLQPWARKALTADPSLIDL